MNIRALILSALVLLKLASAQSNPATTAARDWQQAHRAQILHEFTELLSIPNVATDTENIQRNANALVAMLQKRGVESRLLTMPGVNPVVFGEIRAPQAKHTIVFYAHYDGQPVTPAEWEGNARLPLRFAGSTAKTGSSRVPPPTTKPQSSRNSRRSTLSAPLTFPCDPTFVSFGKGKRKRAPVILSQS